jgi:hypothetical protein
MFISRFGDSIEVNGNVPLIREITLKHDQSGPTYNNGPYMVMERCVEKLYSLFKFVIANRNISFFLLEASAGAVCSCT